jgi:hypothetical protein
LPHGRVYKARGAPLQNDRPYYLATYVNSLYSQSRELSCNHIHQAYSPGCRVLRISKRPEPVNLVYCSSCNRHEPFCYSCRHRPTPKSTLRGNPGCAVGPKTPTGLAAAEGRGARARRSWAAWAARGGEKCGRTGEREGLGQKRPSRGGIFFLFLFLFLISISISFISFF